MTDAEKVAALKVIIRQAIELHVPKHPDRDPRWTRLVNALYMGTVRVAGPLPFLSEPTPKSRKR